MYFCIIFLCSGARLLSVLLVVKWCYFRVISLMFVCVSTWLTERLLPAKRGNCATEGCDISQYFARKTVNATVIGYRNWIKWDYFRDFAYFCHPRPFAFMCRAFVKCTKIYVHNDIDRKSAWPWYLVFCDYFLKYVIMLLFQRVVCWRFAVSTRY